MRRASMRMAIRPLWERDGLSHTRGLKTTAMIDSTIHTVISVCPRRPKRRAKHKGVP
jgi:hypothetical protein